MTDLSFDKMGELTQLVILSSIKEKIVREFVFTRLANLESSDKDSLNKDLEQFCQPHFQKINSLLDQYKTDKNWDVYLDGLREFLK